MVNPALAVKLLGISVENNVVNARLVDTDLLKKQNDNNLQQLGFPMDQQPMDSFIKQKGRSDTKWGIWQRRN